MKKYEKEVVQSELNNEKAVLKNLKRAYQEALFEVDDKIAQLLGRSDADQQHVIYQVEYQRALKKQINGILDALHTKEFETISEYLSQTYDEGFIGTLYTLQAQGVPLAFPINQELVVSAIQHETMLTSSLYTELGLSIQTLKKEIASEISRGMVNALPYKEIARNVANRSNIPLNKAMTIARTEGHRIRETAADHTRTRARQAGADVIDFWDAALDGKTRTTHRMLDGQRRNKKGYFEANGKKAKYPGGFGDPAEDINCRCRVRSEASWALDEGDTKMLGNVSKMSDEEKQEIADKLGIPVGDLEQYSNSIVPIKAKNYDDFKQQYSKLWRYDDKVPVRTSSGASSVRSSAQKMKTSDVLENNGKSSKIDFKEAKGIEEAKKYAKDALGLEYYDMDKANIDCANMINRAITEIYNVFGNIKSSGYLVGVRIYPKKADWYAAYSQGFREVFLKNITAKNSISKMAKDAKGQFAMGFWSSDNAEHAIRHEIGHALQHWFTDDDAEKLKKIADLREQVTKKCGITTWSMTDTKEHVKAAGDVISYYALRNDGEFIAESVAEYMSGNPRDVARQVVEILLEGR